MSSGGLSDGPGNMDGRWMVRKLLTLLLLLPLLLLPQPSFSQTPSYSLTWDQPLPAGQTFADVQSFSWTLQVGTAPAAAVTPVCVNSVTIRCSIPLPTRGTSYTITAINGFGQASASISGVGPGTPINITVIIKVTP